MATHSSILAGRIPWTEEPGGATVHGVAKRWRRLSEFHSLTQSPVGFPGGWVVKNSPANAGDRYDPWVGKIPWSNPLQYSCLENPMDKGAQQVTVYRVTEKSDVTE